MKLIFTYLFLFLFSNLAFAKSTINDSIVKVKTYWNINDTKSYTFHTKETKETSDQIKHDEIAYRVKISVDDLIDDELTVTWIYDTVKFNAPNFVNNPLFLINDVPIRFVINQNGRFLRYIDLDHTIESFKKSANKISSNYQNDTITLEKIDKIVQHFASEDHIAKIFEKDIRQFHLFYSENTYQINSDPIVSKTYMDNLFNTSPTPATTFITLENIAFTGTNYTMKATQIADPEWLSNSWYNYLVQLSESLNQEKPDESRKHDTIVYTVDTTSRIRDNGWLSTSTETKKVVFQDTNYTLIRTIELD